jgi:ankyrin repeat protein
MENSPFVYYPQDVNITDTKGNTPLYYACYNGNLRMCHFLAEKGADVNNICFKGETPFHMAFKSGSPEVKLIINLANNHRL